MSFSASAAVGVSDASRHRMEAQPSGIEGRRQMPQFNLSDDEIREVTDFLLWTNKIRTQDWPPNDAG